MTFVLLLNRKSPARSDIQDWLSSNGLVTWLANDVSHVIEELSDFTVRNRPDVVLLDVAFLKESYKTLHTTLEMASDDVTVVDFGQRNSVNDKPFAADFDLLGKMMHRKQMSSSCRDEN